MAHPPPVYTSHRNGKHTDYLNEKQVQRKCHYEMTNSNVPTHPHNEVLNRFANLQDSPMKNSASEKRCQVYVHQFNKIPSRCFNMETNWKCGNEIHQTMYKHEFSDYYGAKIQCLRKQFDNLSLNSKTMQTSTSSPNRIPKPIICHDKPSALERMDFNSRPTKMPQVKSSPTARINKSFLFKPENKAVVDKLEESYWTKWKPTKVADAKAPQPKMKGLYTENETINVPYQFVATNEKKERGDSNEAITACTSSTKHETSSSNITYVDHMQPPQNYCSLCTAAESELSSDREDGNSVVTNTEQDQKSKSQNSIPVVEENENQDELAVSNPPETVVAKLDTESSVNILKHTDSFILTSKKQSLEKPRYQQPKCIKLFKNLGYTTTTPTNYIKGGTYPLKSCLKKSNPTKPSSPLRSPGRSVIIGSFNRKQGKANRYTT